MRHTELLVLCSSYEMDPAYSTLQIQPILSKGEIWYMNMNNCLPRQRLSILHNFVRKFTMLTEQPYFYFVIYEKQRNGYTLY